MILLCEGAKAYILGAEDFHHSADSECRLLSLLYQQILEKWSFFMKKINKSLEQINKSNEQIPFKQTRIIINIIKKASSCLKYVDCNCGNKPLQSSLPNFI